MALSVCLLFDPRGDELVRSLWARLERQGIRTLQTHTHGRHYPHLSYAVLLEWDVDRVIDALSALPDGGPFAVVGHGTVVFPRGRVTLAPAVSVDVMARQALVARALEETGATLHRHYQQGQWVPHISVATRARGEDLSAVVTAVSDTLPLELNVERAVLVDTATGQVRSLPHVP